jgi:hypothetical protein
MSGDVSGTEYTTSYSPSTPTWMTNQQIVGSGARQGKVFKPLLNTDERQTLRESMESASSPKIVRQASNLPSINGPLG